MQACKRLERSKPAKRQATVQGCGVCTLHHTGVAQTSGSSEHPGPCLGHQRPLPPSGPTSTPRHGGSSHVSRQGPHSCPSASCMAQTHDTTALPIVSGGHASHTINNREKEVKHQMIVYTRSAICILQFSTAIAVVDCCTDYGVRAPHVLPRLSVRLRRNRTKALRTRSPEWLVTLLLSRISLSLRVCVYELSPETCSSGFEDYLLAPKRIDVLTQE